MYVGAKSEEARREAMELPPVDNIPFTGPVRLICKGSSWPRARCGPTPPNRSSRISIRHSYPKAVNCRYPGTG